VTRRARSRIAAPLDVLFGTGYLVAGLLPARLPAAWHEVIAGLAMVSLGAAYAMPLAGAVLSRADGDARAVRRQVVLLGLLLCVLLPLMMLHRHPAAPPAGLLLPALVVLPGVWALWCAAGDPWPGLRLERRVAAFLPLSAAVVGMVFFALLYAGRVDHGAIAVLAGLSMLVVAASRKLLGRRGAVPPPPA
jgi:hypothetical protein